MDNQLLDGFYLEGWLVEPVTGQYTSSTRSGHLSSRAVEVLLCLAKHPRRLMPREELLTKVWGDGNGSAEALSHAISDLRHAFGDNAAKPTYIQTVPRRGYRLLVEPRPKSGETTTDIQALVAPVTSMPATKEHTFWQSMIRHGVVQASVAYLVFGWLLIQVADATFDNLGFPSWSVLFVTYVVIGGFPLVVLLSWFLEMAEGRMVRDYGEQGGSWLKGLERNYLAIIAAYGLAVIGVGAYHGLVGFKGHGPPQVIANSEPAEDELIPVDENSIAVLKFLNLDGSPTTNIFSEGLSEDILDRLARLPGIKVSSRGDSWSLPPNAASDVVRRRLRVAYFVEGSVRLVGDELRVVAQLIDSGNGYHIVSRSFDKQLNDYMHVQNEIAQLIVANLQVALPDREQYDSVVSNDAPDVDAYILYRQGVEALREPGTLETKTAAIEFFDKALQVDPGYAAAYAGICNARIGLYDINHVPEEMHAAQSACGAALAKGGQLPSVLHALGLLAHTTGRYSDAADRYEEALASNPQDAAAMRGLASAYSAMHRNDEAETLLLAAADLQPGNWSTYNQTGNFYFSLGRYAEAAREYRKVTLLNPDNYVLLSNLGSTQILAGDLQGARKSLEQALALESRETTYSNLGVVYYYLGDFEKSVETHRKATETAPESRVAWANLADALYFSGDTDAAQAAFKRAAELSRQHLAINPADTEAILTLAWAECMLGNAEESNMLIQRAISASPDDPYAHYYDGLIKNINGDYAGAQEAMRRAADMGYPKIVLGMDPYLHKLRLASDFENWLHEPAG
jgi:tetratricopeptide (TPR) repeat protein/DNA-binding winged helix-turn-helix (wHTH) protein